MLFNIEKINSGFERIAEHLMKYRWLYLAMLVVTIAACAYGSKLVKIDTSNENSFLESDSINIETEYFKDVLETINMFWYYWKMKTFFLIKHFH